jgi:hypothetical protein
MIVEDSLYPNPVIERALQSSPGSEAEHLTGGRMGIDPGTNLIALALAQERAGDLEAILSEFDDTSRRHDYRHFRQALVGQGFDFQRSTRLHERRREERWFHRDGVEALVHVVWHRLLGADRVDNAIIRYNWLPGAHDPGWKIHGSGTVRRLDEHGSSAYIYVCSLDVRVAMKFKLARLRTLGSFLWPWVGEIPV